MKTTTPLGDRLRLMAQQRRLSGQIERAEGLMQASDLVDEHAALLTGKALVEALGQMMDERLEGFVADVVAALRTEAASGVTTLAGSPPGFQEFAAATQAQARRPRKQPASAARATTQAARGTNGQGMGKGERRVLVAIAQHHPTPVPGDQITALTGYKRSTRDAYMQRLEAASCIVRTQAGATITKQGFSDLGAYERLPTGKALLAWWLDRLPEGEAAILEYVAKFYPHPIDRERVGESTHYKRSTRDAYIQRLEAKRLLESPGAGHVAATAHLFDKP